MAELTNRVYELLNSLHSEKDSPLPELFSELGYDYSRSDAMPLFKKWTDSQIEYIDHAEILVENGDFKVFWIRLTSDKLQRGKQRNIINRLNTEFPYNLTIFSNMADDTWDFVNVKLVSEELDEDNKNSKKRKLIRRIRIDDSGRLRTASERIRKLEIVDELISPIALQSKHDDAFDVEQVTD